MSDRYKYITRNIYPLKIKLHSEHGIFMFKFEDLKEPQIKPEDYDSDNQLFFSIAIKIRREDMEMFLSQAREYIHLNSMPNPNSYSRDKLNRINSTYYKITEGDWKHIAALNSVKQIFLKKETATIFFYYIQRKRTGEYHDPEKIVKDNIEIIIGTIFKPGKFIINAPEDEDEDEDEKLTLKLKTSDIIQDSIKEISATPPYYEVSLAVSFEIVVHYTIIKYIIDLNGDLNLRRLPYKPVYSIPTLDPKYVNVYLPDTILLTTADIASANLSELNITSYKEIFLIPGILAKFILKIKDAYKNNKIIHKTKNANIKSNIKLITEILFYGETSFYNSDSKKLFGKVNEFKYNDNTYQIIKSEIMYLSRALHTPETKNNETIYKIDIVLDILDTVEPITYSRKKGIHCRDRAKNLQTLLKKLNPNLHFKFGKQYEKLKHRAPIPYLFNKMGGRKSRKKLNIKKKKIKTVRKLKYMINNNTRKKEKKKKTQKRNKRKIQKRNKRKY